MKIATVGVLGGGQMGIGIVQVCAQAGIQVKLADVSREAAEKSKSRLAGTFARLVEKAKVTQAEVDTAMARLEIVDGIAGLANVDLAIEAVTENLELKCSLFRQLDEVVRAGAILATNTSSISITRIAAVTERPELVVGMHFMNPVPLMKLVEIIRALQTSNATYEATVELAQALGKTVVTSQDSPGFIVNRVLIPMLNEACFALESGVGTTVDIDQGIKLGLNHPMGPFELADLIGLDTVLAISEVLHREIGDDKYRPAPILRKYVAAGWLGRKTKRGFHSY